MGRVFTNPTRIHTRLGDSGATHRHCCVENGMPHTDLFLPRRLLPSEARRWRRVLALIATCALLWVTVPPAHGQLYAPPPRSVPFTVRDSGWRDSHTPPLGLFTAEVTRDFDPPAQRWLSGHRGVDLAGSAGEGVFASGAGIVVFVGRPGGVPTVSIDHDSGIRTTYQPVTAEVFLGERVARGTRIGVLEAGHEGCASAACLHWGARTSQGRYPDYMDPILLLGGYELTLKPVDVPADRPTADAGG